jgi:hypothetical protein
VTLTADPRIVLRAPSLTFDLRIEQLAERGFLSPDQPAVVPETPPPEAGRA